MKIKTWNPEMTLAEAKDLAYRERNMLALWMATLFKGECGVTRK